VANISYDSPVFVTAELDIRVQHVSATVDVPPLVTTNKAWDRTGACVSQCRRRCWYMYL